MKVEDQESGEGQGTKVRRKGFGWEAGTELEGVGQSGRVWLNGRSVVKRGGLDHVWKMALGGEVWPSVGGVANWGRWG